MTRLTFLCHGATEANRQARFPLDEPLEERARTAAEALAARLPRADCVLTSPALRARQTANALGLTAVVAPELADCHYRRWTGQSITAIGEAEPDALVAWMSDVEAAPHGGESIAALHARLVPWMAAQSTRGGHTIAISHAPVIRAAMLIALQAPLSSFWHIDVEPLSAVHMTSNGHRWSLRFDRV
jgi:broad specificity phosphatase PhoE